jgi:glycosyltransferase involved in cell wall biosynthesis
LGAEGLELRHREHALIADERTDFVAACVEALREPEALRGYTERAREMIVREHSWPVVTDAFEEMVRRCLREEEAGRVKGEPVRT